jgi:protein-S-isoprenylcysteine O-methyltransferase Ste14
VTDLYCCTEVGMQRRFEVRISNRPRPNTDSGLPSAGLTSRVRNFLYGFVALLFVAIAIVVGVTLGTAIAVTNAALVIVALATLIVRG